MKAIALLSALSGCWGSTAPGPQSQDSEPIATHQRGPIDVSSFRTGGLESSVWCTISVDGAPLAGFGPKEVRHCSVPPRNVVSASFVVHGGPKTGAYLMVQDGADVIRLGDQPRFAGRWSSDGTRYITHTHIIHIATGRQQELPAQDGVFVAFSPDGQALLTIRDRATQGLVDLWVVDIDAGTATHSEVAREAWAKDSTGSSTGCKECSHLSLAARAIWTEGPAGWRVYFE